MLQRLVLAVCLSTSPALAQASFSASYQGLGSADFTLVEEDIDGTFIAVGESRPGPAFVTRLDASGQVMWARSISATTATVLDIEIASNGDILLCGSYQSGALGMRLDSSGTMIWTTQLPFQVLGGGQSGLARAFSSVLESSTGQIFFGGNTLDPVGSQPLFLLASTDAQGTLLWESIFGMGSSPTWSSSPAGPLRWWAVACSRSSGSPA